jgi:SSS family solute:Na+ symporter
MLIFSIFVILVVSRFTKAATAEQVQGLTFSSASAEQKAATRHSWNRWDVIHTVIILGITVAFYIYFW